MKNNVSSSNGDILGSVLKVIVYRQGVTSI